MSNITVEELKELQRAPLYTADDEQFGHVGEIWYDESTGRARFLKVGRAPLGLRTVLVPVQGGTRHRDGFQVPYTREQLEESPDVDPEGWDDESEREFTSYYEEYDRERDQLEDAEASITRHEEELEVGKRETEAGTARLRKWVDTEPVEVDVELKRETARVYRESIDRTVSDADLGEDEVEVPLREEEAVVQKQTVAKERVGIEKDVETTQETVSDEVRKEHVEVETDDDAPVRRER
jgi:uncharacterized protein (TIGR02271 family)